MNARLCFACRQLFQPLPRDGRPNLLCPACARSAVAIVSYARAQKPPMRLSACVVCRLPMARRSGAFTCSPRCRKLLSRAPIYLVGDERVPELDAVSGPARPSSPVARSFDIDSFSDPSFARSLAPGVHRPSPGQLAGAVFDHPLFPPVLARFVDSEYLARDDLLAFFVAAGGTSRLTAQSSASTYASLCALLVWLVPSLPT